MKILKLFVLLFGVAEYTTAHSASLCDTGRQQSPVSFVAVDIKRNPTLRPIQLSISCRIGDAQRMYLERRPAEGSVGVLKGDTPCTVRDPITSRQIPFDHFELHRGPEHAFSNVAADMEAQLYFKDNETAIALGVPVVCLSKLNDATHTSDFLDMFVQLSRSATRRFNDTFVSGQFDAHPHGILHLIPIMDRGYVTYSGSHTSGQCDEGVQWYVFTSPLHVRVGLDLEEEQALSASNAKANASNVRPLQPLNNRPVSRFVDATAHADANGYYSKLNKQTPGHEGDRLLGSSTAVLAALSGFILAFVVSLYLFNRFTHKKMPTRNFAGHDGESVGERNRLARHAPAGYGGV